MVSAAKLRRAQENVVAARPYAAKLGEVLGRLAKALGVKAEHFREYRIRVITEKLEKTPELVDRLYKRLA